MIERAVHQLRIPLIARAYDKPPCSIIVWDKNDHKDPQLSENLRQQTSRIIVDPTGRRIPGGEPGGLTDMISIPIDQTMSIEEVIRLVIRRADGRPIALLVFADHGSTYPWDMNGMQVGNANNWLRPQHLIPLRHYLNHPNSRILLVGCTNGSLPYSHYRWQLAQAAGCNITAAFCYPSITRNPRIPISAFSPRNDFSAWVTTSPKDSEPCPLLTFDDYPRIRVPVPSERESLGVYSQYSGRVYWTTLTIPPYFSPDVINPAEIPAAIELHNQLNPQLRD